MIRVKPQPEPAEFEALVRQPGRAFLEKVPKPDSKQFSRHRYWSEISRELFDAYDAICAYSCHWIPGDTGFKTVEHFRPKSKYPNHAYEWSNYRLVCGLLNGRKREHEDVLDPFKIEDGWFVLDFPSLLIKPAKGLEAGVRAQVIATRDRLKLNIDENCVEARRHWIEEYCRPENRDFGFLRRNAPFIAREIERQKLADKLPEIMAFDFSSDAQETQARGRE